MASKACVICTKLAVYVCETNITATLKLSLRAIKGEHPLSEK